jgi:hypothetical protein
MKFKEPNQLVTYCSNDRIKNAIRDLRDIGFHYFSIEKKKVTAHKFYFQKSDFEPTKVVDILQRLRLLAT